MSITQAARVLRVTREYLSRVVHKRKNNPQLLADYHALLQANNPKMQNEKAN